MEKTISAMAERGEVDDALVLLLQVGLARLGHSLACACVCPRAIVESTRRCCVLRRLDVVQITCTWLRVYARTSRKAALLCVDLQPLRPCFGLHHLIHPLSTG